MRTKAMKRILVLSLFLASLVASIHADDKFITHVSLTTYNATKAQCDSNPNETANGTIIDHKKLKQGKLKYCAISRDLLWCIPMGSVIEIEGHGRYEVVDTMNARFNHYIDILQHHTEKNFKKEKIKVVVVKKPQKK